MDYCIGYKYPNDKRDLAGARVRGRWGVGDVYSMYSAHVDTYIYVV